MKGQHWGDRSSIGLGFLAGILLASTPLPATAQDVPRPTEQPTEKLDDLVDATYGSRIRHLRKDDGHEHNLYYYRNPWNADGSRMIGIHSDLQQKDWRVVLHDGDGLFIRELFPISRFDWRLTWDRNDPDILYTWRGSDLYRFDVASAKADLLKSFAPLRLKPNGPSCNQAGDRILVITEDDTFRSYHLPEMGDERTFRIAVPPGGSVSWDKPRYTGFRNYIDTAFRSADSAQQAIVVYDDTGEVVHKFDGIGGGGHYAYSPDGKLAYFKLPVSPRRGPERPLEIHVVNLDGTGDRTLFSVPWAKAMHVQNLHLAWPSKVGDWFIATFFPAGGNVPPTYSPPLDEILLVRIDGDWRYIGRTETNYSRAGARGSSADMFWAQPLAAPSSDGSRICFNSNRAGTIDQFILYVRP